MTTQTLDQRQAAMRQNAGDWLIKHRAVLLLCQATLLEKYYDAEGRDELNTPLSEFLQEIEDVINVIGLTMADLRQQSF